MAEAENEIKYQRKKINRRITKKRRCSFWEDEVSTWNDTEFKRHFRMSHDTFKYLVQLVVDHLSRNLIQRGKPLSAEKIVAIAIWKLATGESYRALALRFGVGDSTAWMCTMEFCRVVTTHLTHKYIRWPQTNEECIAVKTKFAKRKGAFIGCMGAIDGFHVPIHRPASDPLDTYRNRKGWTSLNCVGVVDANKMFMLVNISWPGSVNDKRVLRNSSLCRQSWRFFDPNSYILGDSGYPLRNWLLTPYISHNFLTRSQRRFNYFHSSSRIVVEHAFGELKGRWRCCLLKLYAKPWYAVNIITTCCTLHNICRHKDDRFWPEWTVSRNEEERLGVIQPAVNSNESEGVTLKEWRDALCRRLNNANGS